MGHRYMQAKGRFTRRFPPLKRRVREDLQPGFTSLTPETGFR